MKNYLTLLFIAAVSLGTVKAQWGDGTQSLSLKFGAAPATNMNEFFDGWWVDYDCCFDRENGLHGLWPGGAGYDYRGKMVTPGAISLAYNYRVLKWLEISATATYTGFFQKSFSNETGSRTGDLSRHYFYFMPGLDFVWLRRRVIEMYSGFAIGGGFVVSKNNWDPWENKGFVGGQFTMLGIRIGAGKLYFMSELGYGMKGVFTGGMGVRF